MDGQVLKERLSKLTNLTQMELAEKLNVSQQSFSQYFLAKDVKSGLLERLAEIIGVDIPTMYGIEPAPTISHNAGDVITGDNIANRVNDMGAQMITILDEQLKVKDEQIRVRDEQIGKLINIMYKNENDFVRAINLGLKEIGAELGIERLQFYAARHSWATIARNDLHIGKDTINEALNHVDSTMAVTDTYIRKSFDNLNEANRKVVDYIVGLKLA